MNKKRMKALEALAASVRELEDEAAVIAVEERDAFDNMPEGLQESERGQRTSENADTLEEFQTTLGDLASEIEALIEAQE